MNNYFCFENTLIKQQLNPFYQELNLYLELHLSELKHQIIPNNLIDLLVISAKV